MKGNKGKGEKMSEDISEGDKTWKTPNSRKWTRGSGKGGRQGVGVTGWWALRGHLVEWALGVMLYVAKLNSNKNNNNLKNNKKTIIVENWCTVSSVTGCNKV